MNIKDAIKIHNELEDNEMIQKYMEALHIVVNNLDKKPKEEYYKSSKERDYYIELPYMKLELKNGKAVYKKHYYNAIYKNKDGSGGANYCLSLCKYNRKYIENFIDKRIQEGDK